MNSFLLWRSLLAASRKSQSKACPLFLSTISTYSLATFWWSHPTKFKQQHHPENSDSSQSGLKKRNEIWPVRANKPEAICHWHLTSVKNIPKTMEQLHNDWVAWRNTHLDTVLKLGGFLALHKQFRLCFLGMMSSVSVSFHPNMSSEVQARFWGSTWQLGFSEPQSVVVGSVHFTLFH